MTTSTSDEADPRKEGHPVTDVKNIVLAHGGFVDGSDWQGVYDLLSADGFNVSVVQNQTLSLESDVETTHNVLDLQDGPAILVGHSYGAVIALLVAAQRPGAVRSLTVSEPGCLRVAAGNPVVDEMISNGERLFAHASSIPPEDFLRLFRGGAGSAWGRTAAWRSSARRGSTVRTASCTT